jgi:uridine kinase
VVTSIFIAGGSCSGKSELARAIVNALGQHRAVVIQEDSYFYDRPSNGEEANRGVNLDVPEAKEQSLLRAHVMTLRDGKPAPNVEFDFKLRSRRPVSTMIEPREFIIVEGMHVLADQGLRSCADLKVFVDAPEFLRFARRLVRDSVERGRTLDFITDQFLGSVRSGHNLTVEPQRAWADVVIDGGAGLSVSPAPGQQVFKDDTLALLARIGA